jgi:hypothetical protein
MWEEAVWKPWGVGTGWGRVARLERGQLSHSLRDLAAIWKWSSSTVKRFLKKLVEGDRITTSIQGGQCVISILDYDECNGTPGNGTTSRPVTPSNTTEIPEQAPQSGTTCEAVRSDNSTAAQPRHKVGTTSEAASDCKDEEIPEMPVEDGTTRDEKRHATKVKNTLSKKDSDANASGALPRSEGVDDLFGPAKAKPQPAKEPPVRSPEAQARDDLFRDLLDPLGGLLHTDTKGARDMLGKLLRASGKNAGHVREAFAALHARPDVADPETYMMRVISRRRDGIGAPAPVARPRRCDVATVAEKVAIVQRLHLEDLAKQGQSASPETAPSGVDDYPADITIELEALP